MMDASPFQVGRAEEHRESQGISADWRRALRRIGEQLACHTVTRRSPPSRSAESAAVADCISSDPCTVCELAGMCRLARWWPKSLFGAALAHDS